MADFKKQIQEDIENYQWQYRYINNIDKPEWAFNFWILDKLFSIEESLIEDYIVDYNDKGIDCFVWHEDRHDLYLIQNKYYEEGTTLTVDYVFNDFLTRALGALEKGTYTRSEELQNIYTKYHDEEDFNLHFHLYVTNNSCKTKTLTDKLAEYNEKNSSNRIEARLFSIDDIQDAYYKGPIKDIQNFKYKISTINKGTMLKIDNAAYKMTLAADARYVLTPVTVVYQMLKEAKRCNYSLFSENIREYLGNNGPVNKKISDTLKDPNDRNNFFFYNNGVTMIVEKLGGDTSENDRRIFYVFNPQIVNGCQTVNTIYEVLNLFPETKLEQDFANTYVMIKILQIPTNDDAKKELYKNIVTYNNSQNSINEKTFAASTDLFKRLQSEFEGKGFLVNIKQSDKHSFAQKYKKPTLLAESSSSFLERYALSLTKTSDYMIDLEKLLQVFLSFCSKATDAIQNKSKLLKADSLQHQLILQFLKNAEVTNNDKLNLLLLYLRAEKEKKNSKDNKSPNPFYLVHWFAQYECGSDPSKISEKLSSFRAVNNIIKKYSMMFKQYYRKWSEKNPGKDYNTMIKAPIDIDIQKDCYNTVSDFLNEDV